VGERRVVILPETDPQKKKKKTFGEEGKGRTHGWRGCPFVFGGNRDQIKLSTAVAPFRELGVVKGGN